MGVDKRLNVRVLGCKRAKPLGVPGMGNPTIPMGKSRGDIGNTGIDFHSKDYWYGVGSEPLK